MTRVRDLAMTPGPKGTRGRAATTIYRRHSGRPASYPNLSDRLRLNFPAIPGTWDFVSWVTSGEQLSIAMSPCFYPDSNPRPPTTQTCWCGRRQTGEFRGIMVGFSWAVAPLSASVASLLASVASLSASLPPLIFAVPVGFRPAPTGPAAIPRAHRTPMWQPAPSPPASRINFWPYL